MNRQHTHGGERNTLVYCYKAYGRAMCFKYLFFGVTFSDGQDALPFTSPSEWPLLGRDIYLSNLFPVHVRDSSVCISGYMSLVTKPRHTGYHVIYQQGQKRCFPYIILFSS